MKKLIISSIIGVGLVGASSGLVAAYDEQTDEFNTTENQAVESADLSSNLSLSSKKHVSFNSLPADVRRAIRSQAGASQIKSVDKGTWRGTAYQVSFDRSGRHVEMQIAENGTILNNNPRHDIRVSLSNVQSVNYDQLPTEVQDVLSQQLGQAQIESIDKGTWRGTVYQASLDKPGMTKLFVAEDGSLLERPALTEAAGAQSGASSSTGTAGISHEMQGATAMDFKDLPWSAQKAMLDRSGYAHITSVDKYTLSDGRTAYRGTYSKDNKNHEIRVTQDGTILSDRESSGHHRGSHALQPLSGATKVQFSDLPEAVQKSAKSRIGSTQVEDIDKGMLNGQTVYELAYKKGDRTSELRIREDGKILGEHFD